jgi:hypothetical protein
MMMLSAPVAKGEYFKLGGLWGSSAATNWINDNRPIMSGSQLLDKLAVLFNAKWLVSNGNLIFERKDNILVTAGNWLDIVNSNVIDSVGHNLGVEINVIGDGYCIGWLDEDVPSYLNIGYSSEMVEQEGQARFNEYRHIVDYNPSKNTIQKGERKIVFDFGASSFADDCDFFYPMRNTGINGWLNFFGADATPEDVLIMGQDTTYFDKLLIPGDVYVMADGQQRQKIKFVYGDITVLPYGVTRQNPALTLNDIVCDKKRGGGRFYNYPLNVNPNHNGNIYDFHRIDEPWNRTYNTKSIEVTLLVDCRTISFATVKKGVNTPYGIMTVDKIEIKYKDKAMTLIGKI